MRTNSVHASTPLSFLPDLAEKILRVDPRSSRGAALSRHGGRGGRRIKGLSRPSPIGTRLPARSARFAGRCPTPCMTCVGKANVVQRLYRGERVRLTIFRIQVRVRLDAPQRCGSWTPEAHPLSARSCSSAECTHRLEAGSGGAQPAGVRPVFLKYDACPKRSTPSSAKKRVGRATNRKPAAKANQRFPALQDALVALRSSGETGFEGFVRDALEEVTGERFRLMKSGPQSGVDALSECGIGMEAKRYGASTPLPAR